MRPATKVALALLILFLVFLGYAVVQGLNTLATVSHHEQNMAPLIETACLSYMTEYGRLPPDADNQKLTAALMGDNSRQIAFISLSKNQLNAKNEMVDRWGTPLRIAFLGSTTIQVTSAGPDKIFGTADDIVSNNPASPPPQ
jgi:hypothetical protein